MTNIQESIEAVLRFHVVVGTDAKVSNMTLVQGNPLLVPAARDAVKQWVYKPMMVNGQAVEVETDVAVKFTLPQ